MFYFEINHEEKKEGKKTINYLHIVKNIIIMNNNIRGEK